MSEIVYEATEIKVTNGRVGSRHGEPISIEQEFTAYEVVVTKDGAEWVEVLSEDHMPIFVKGLQAAARLLGAEARDAGAAKRQERIQAFLTRMRTGELES